MILKMLKPGYPCPCCGQPIKTKDPDTLLEDDDELLPSDWRRGE